jgi:arylsulfatase A-like enzyme
LTIAAFTLCLPEFAFADAVDEQPARPNVLLAIADDWGWPHAGAYGDPVVKTSTFDRLAREGVLFNHAYVSSPSCTPSRGALLTGQWHWRLRAGANLWSIFPNDIPTYPELLAESGYEVGVTGKGWGPGRAETQGRPITGKPFKDFREFLDQRDPKKPFCFWLGTTDPHRPYELGSGEASGMDLSAIRLPACFPDNEVVRGDVADYYFEVQRFDRLVGSALDALSEIGELDNTIVVMTGDHGMPFPRGKANQYDTGTRVPLAVRYPARISKARTIDDFVSLTDLAPTFLEVAGVAIPDAMTGRSLIDVLESDKSGRVDPERDHVLSGKERHVPCQEKPIMGGYPCRSIRTHDFLYIRNYEPDRWPSGTPDWRNAAIEGAWLADCDNGPTKTFMFENRDRDEHHRRLYDLAFAKRPAEELYDLRSDPDQLANVAGQAKFADVQKRLAAQLEEELIATDDPRAIGKGRQFDEYPYLGGAPKHPEWEKENSPSR